MTISNWRLGLGFWSCLAMGTLAFSQQGLAHDNPEKCGGLVDGDGEPVVQGEGNIVLHAGSGPCPEEPTAAQPTATGQGPITANIYFDFDDALPNADGQAALAALIDALSANAPSNVSVAGHADRAGSEAYNEGLSGQRANNVASALANAGISADAINTEAFGESAPAVATPDGVREPENRRVEVTAE